MTAFNNLIRPDLSNYAPASNLSFNEKVNNLKASGKKIHHLAFGQSPFPIMDGMVEALKENAHRNEYLPVAGIPELREAIADFLLRYDNLSVSPDNIIIGPGSKELIYLCLNVFHGDVMVLSPCWTTYRPQSMLAHHSPHVIVTSSKDQWRLTPQQLEETIKQKELTGNKLLILCNPDNPTGASYSEEQLKALSSVLREHNVIVITDEIYSRLNFSQQHHSLAKFYPEGTIISSGFSKWASAGGWRVGYHIYPVQLNSLKSAVTSAASHTYSCAPAPMQYALAKALKNTEECDEYIKHSSRILSAVADFTHRELSSVGVKCCPSLAGFYLFPDFSVLRESLARRGIMTGNQMCAALFEEASIALMSGGPAFLRPDEELTTRLCFICFDGKIALEESRKLGLDKSLNEDFVKQYCTELYDAIMALKNWVKKQLE